MKSLLLGKSLFAILRRIYLQLGLNWQDFSRVSLNDPDIVGHRTRKNLDEIPREYGGEVRKAIKSVLEAGGAEYGQEKRRSRRP